jgi:hypothetical protein
MKMVTLLVALVIFCLVGSMVFARQQSTKNVSLQQLSSKVIERIAFGSCAKQWQHQTIKHEPSVQIHGHKYAQ